MEDPNKLQRKMSTAGVSLYKTLGLEKGASPEDIKKAYRCVHKDQATRRFGFQGYIMSSVYIYSINCYSLVYSRTAS